MPPACTAGTIARAVATSTTLREAYRQTRDILPSPCPASVACGVSGHQLTHRFRNGLIARRLSPCPCQMNCAPEFAAEALVRVAWPRLRGHAKCTESDIGHAKKAVAMPPH